MNTIFFLITEFHSILKRRPLLWNPIISCHLNRFGMHIISTIVLLVKTLEKTFVCFSQSLALLENKKRESHFCNSLSFKVVPTGIEPVTQGFSVLCSTNWAMAPCLFADAKVHTFSGYTNILCKILLFSLGYSKSLL